VTDPKQAFTQPPKLTLTEAGATPGATLPLPVAQQWLPGVLVSLVLIWLLLWLVDWRAMISSLSAVNLSALVVALFFYGGSALSRAVSWQTLLQKRVAWGRAFVVLQEGYLLNNLFPFRLGDLARAFLISRTTGGSPLPALAAIIMERLYDVALAATILLATLPFILNLRQTYLFATLVLMVVMIAFGVLFLIVRNQQVLQQRVEPILHRSPRLLQAASQSLFRLFEGFAILQQPGQALVGLGWLLLSWLCLAGEYYIVLRQLVPDATPAWAGFALAAGMLGGAIPSAPSGLGVYEAAVVGALALVLVPFSAALSFALIIHLIHIVISSAIGLYAIAREGETLWGFYRKVRQMAARR
jgi:glycosyltransferase 2 family protein